MASSPSITDTFETLRRTIRSGELNPLNVLQGPEGYFIDELVKAFEEAIPEEDRDFALTNMYAPQVADAQAVVDMCRQIPMMTDRQMVILREAQEANEAFINKLASYAASPTPTTVLVIASRGKNLKGKNFLTAVKKSRGVIFDSNKLGDWQIKPVLSGIIKTRGLRADDKALEMLAQHVGTDLSRLYNEVDKLAQILGPGASITPEAVERNVGVSKDYNNFELLDAVANRDAARMMRICAYFEANPKANPYVPVTAILFSFFANLLQLFYTPAGVDPAREMGITATAVKRLQTARRYYNAFQVIEILDAIRRYDAMSKGNGSRQNPYSLMADLFFHIATAPGKLPV